jgi:hypothetical protein
MKEVRIHHEGHEAHEGIGRVRFAHRFDSRFISRQGAKAQRFKTKFSEFGDIAPLRCGSGQAWRDDFPKHTAAL